MPPEAPIPESLQASTLRAFTVLHQLRQDWGGALILGIGLNPQGAALALATNIAGAVCLKLEPDAATARAALRSGACDFLVNTLDEALRAIKNEIRQRRPLSVALQGDLAQNLEELLDRGVAPQLFCNSIATIPQPAYLSSFAQRFHSAGAAIVSFDESPNRPADPNVAAASDLIDALCRDRAWTAHELRFPDTAALRSFDSSAAAQLPVDDTLRSAWLRAAARLFPRERPPRRALWLTESERTHLEKT